MKKGADDETPGSILNFRATQIPELPVKTATKILTQTEGRGLKQNTRATPKIVGAVMFGYPYVARWGDEYVGGMLDDLMCLAIGMNGDGRNDLINLVKAGGQPPEGYFGNGQPREGGSTSYLRSVHD